MIPLGILALSGAGAAGAYDLLETVSLASSASSVTFSGLDAYTDYKHLQIRMVALTPDYPGMKMSLNGDSSASYSGHELFGNGSSVSSGVNGTSDTQLSGFLRWANDFFGAGIVDILDYANTSKNTTLRAFSGGPGSNQRVGLTSGAYLKTNAVTSVTIAAIGTSASAGSRFSLYGIKGD